MALEVNVFKSESINKLTELENVITNNQPGDISKSNLIDKDPCIIKIAKIAAAILIAIAAIATVLGLGGFVLLPAPLSLLALSVGSFVVGSTLILLAVPVGGILIYRGIKMIQSSQE